MIHHFSMAADNPLRVAQALAQIWRGKVAPFPPHPGSYFVLALDAHGTCIEIYPSGTELSPGLDEVSFSHNPLASRLSATHAALSVPSSQAEIEEIAAREGWLTMRCDREGFFEVIELWIENQMLIELLPPELAPRYLAFMSPANLEQMLMNAPVMA